MKVSKQLLGYIVVMNNLKQTWNESLLNCHLQSLLVKPTIHPVLEAKNLIIAQRMQYIDCLMFCTSDHDVNY